MCGRLGGWGRWGGRQEWADAYIARLTMKIFWWAQKGVLLEMLHLTYKKKVCFVLSVRFCVLFWGFLLFFFLLLFGIFLNLTLKCGLL